MFFFNFHNYSMYTTIYLLNCGMLFVIRPKVLHCYVVILDDLVDALAE